MEKGQIENEKIRKTIQQEADAFIADYTRENVSAADWRSPLIGYADANSPYIKNLGTLITKTHHSPAGILEGCTVILSYFLSFKINDKTAVNADDNHSPQWLLVYTEAEQMLPLLNARLIRVINGLGFNAACPDDTDIISPQNLYSNWSQRHIAYAAGLGSFGINNMLITAHGCCGLFGSLVTNLPVIPDSPQEEEACAYKRSGKCGLCISNCPVGALFVKAPFDRCTCFERLERFKLQGWHNCGKCTTELPCAFCAPQQ